MKVFFPFSYYYPETCAGIFVVDNVMELLANNGTESLLTVPTPTRDVPIGAEWERYELKYNGKAHIHRFHMYGEGKNPILRALRYFLCECVQAHYCLWKDFDVAFIDSTPPIQGLKMPLIKWIRKKPIVYNLQDIFPDSLVNNGLAKKGGLLWKIGRVIENFTYRNADKIIVISEDFKRNIMAKGVPEDKIVVIYNWVDQNAVVDIPRSENKLFDKYGLDRSKFYVTYNGNIGLSQNMELLLQVAKELSNEREQLSIETKTEKTPIDSFDSMNLYDGSCIPQNINEFCSCENQSPSTSLAVENESVGNKQEINSSTLTLTNNEGKVRDEGLEVRDESVEGKVYSVECKEDIRFVLVGEGAYKATLIEKLTETFGEAKKINEDGALQCGPFYLLPFQPYEDISHVFSLGDVSLVISKPGTGAASVPSKTWSIMSASRPVLANFDENELKIILMQNAECRMQNDYLQSKARGIFTKAGDKEAFKDAIITLYHNPDLCKQLGRNGRQFVMDNLTKEVGTRKYVEVIKSVAADFANEQQ